MPQDFFGQGPVCVATIVCNDVIEDKRTGNTSVIGIFNAVAAAALPATHPRMTVLASVTNVEKDIPITLVLRGPEGKQILRAEASLPSRGPGETNDIRFELNNLTFTELGDYVFEIAHADRIIGARKFTVIEHKV